MLAIILRHPLGLRIEFTQALALPLPMVRGSEGRRVVNDSRVEAGGNKEG